MQFKIDEFKRISAILLTETGPLQNRPSWDLFKSLVSDLQQHQTDFYSELSQGQALLSLFASTEPGPTRNTKFKSLLKFFLQYPPEQDFINILAALPHSELQNNLLPFVYENGNRGSTACYILAKTGFSVTAEVFQYFLTARSWNKTDLINLSFLGTSEDTVTICSTLDTSASVQTSLATKEAFAEFSYILFNRPTTEPLFPDLAPIEKQSVPPLVQENQKTDTKHPEEKKSATASFVDTSRIQTVQNQPTHTQKQETLSSFFIPFLTVSICLISGLIISSWYYSEPLQLSQPTLKSTKVPKFWVDAVTQQRITPKFLAADKDYRMAELFLTRDKFSEAMSLLKDALAADSEHLQALFRLGYCHMHLNDHKAAAAAFQKVLARDPRYEYANLYLARIALINNDPQTAIACYKAEYAISRTPAPGIEYANYLSRNGQSNKAKEIINTLKKRFPDKEISLTTNEYESKGTPGAQKK